jgi:hypothetical protein
MVRNTDLLSETSLLAHVHAREGPPVLCLVQMRASFSPDGQSAVFGTKFIEMPQSDYLPATAQPNDAAKAFIDPMKNIAQPPLFWAHHPEAPSAPTSQGSKRKTMEASEVGSYSPASSYRDSGAKRVSIPNSRYNSACFATGRMESLPSDEDEEDDYSAEEEDLCDGVYNCPSLATPGAGWASAPPAARAVSEDDEADSMGDAVDDLLDGDLFFETDPFKDLDDAGPGGLESLLLGASSGNAVQQPVPSGLHLTSFPNGLFA